MRYLLLLFAVIVFTSSNKKDSFSVKGNISGIPDSTKLMLQNLRTDKYLDSAIVLNGTFSFSGSLPDNEPQELRIISSNEDLNKGRLYYTDLLMANENVTIEGKAAELPYNVTTHGSKSQAEAESYNKQLFHWNQKVTNYKALLSKADSVEKIQLTPGLQLLKDSVEQWKIIYIKQNFDKYIALLQYNYRKDFPADTLQSLFAKTPAKLKRSRYGKSIELQIKYPKPVLGSKMYDFSALDANGKTVNLSSFPGKYILLQFAGTGCYWSGLSIKNMKNILEKYQDSVAFISFFIDADKNTWLNTSRQDGISWASLWTDGGKYGEVYNKYGIVGTPTFFLISPDGKIVSEWFGYEDGLIEKEFNKFIKK